MDIGQDYRVTAERFNVIVSEKKVSQKTGLEYWDDIAYLSTVENALKYLVRLEVEKSELADLQNIVERINAIGRDIAKSLAKVSRTALHESLARSGTSDRVSQYVSEK